MKYYWLVVFGMLFFSCEKEDQRVIPMDRGGVTSNVINTGVDGDYSLQHFFDLESNTVVKTVSRTSWDLAFSTGANEHTIRLNSANFMQVINTGETDFYAVTESQVANVYDHSSGNQDSIALKDWYVNGMPTGYVFIVDRGENPRPSGSIPNPSLYKRGEKKVQILSVSPTEYVIKFASVNGSNEQTLVVPKDPTKNNTCISLDNAGSIIDVEPPKDTWDLLFSRYTTYAVLASVSEDYLVTGVLINAEQNVLAVKAFDKTYDNLSFEDVSRYTFTDSLDVIGYDWKLFDGVDDYTILPDKNYLIQDRKGFYYKLKFTDYYNNQGERGVISFVFEKL